MSDPRNTQLTPSFKLAEFLHPGAPIPPPHILDNIQNLANRLQVIRDLLGKAVHINSGYRTAAHNAAVGGASGSMHLTGKAADIVVEGMAAPEVQKFLKNWSGGMGCDPHYTHLDIRNKRERWTYPGGRVPE
jgi:uncharacterized protein YcbK (DUF882 family)